MKRPFERVKSYVTLVNDLMRKRVLYVAEDRKQSSLDGFWETLTPEQISGIEAVAMDMWTRTSLRYGHICRKRMARSFSTSFMWPSIWVMLWTRYGGRKTKL